MLTKETATMANYEKYEKLKGMARMDDPVQTFASLRDLFRERKRLAEIMLMSTDPNTQELLDSINGEIKKALYL